MKMRRVLHLFRFIWLSLLLSTLSYAEAWSGILTDSRAIDWTLAGLPATLPDGETTPNPWTPPTRNVACAMINPSGNATTDTNAINSALASCPGGRYVSLGPGTFLINSNIVMYGIKNVTLRGSGASSTTLSIALGNQVQMGAISGSGLGLLTSGSNFAAGSTSITIGSISGPIVVAGQIAWLGQCDTGVGLQPCSNTPGGDNGGLYVCGDFNGCQTGSDTDIAYAHQQQVVLVTAVTNNGNGTYTVQLDRPIYMPNLALASGAALRWPGLGGTITGLGIEDLTIFTNGPNTVQNNVLMQNAYACWVKGVRFIGSGSNNAPFEMDNSKNVLVMSNYFAADIPLTAAYHASVFVGSSSDTLVLNNITANGIPSEYRGSNSGVVTAFNFGRDAFTAYAENEWSFDHHAFSSFMLYESNQNGGMTEDHIWGTHALNTYFRNYISCYDMPYVGGSVNARGLVIDAEQRFENAIGNAIGDDKGICKTYQGTGYNSLFQISDTDPLVASTLMRWGNVTPVHQSSDTPANSGVRFVASEVPSSLPSPNTSFSNPVPGNNSLPASFFLSTTAHPNGGTGLNWWKVCTAWAIFPTTCSSTQTQSFPTAGPDISNGPYVNGYAYDVPAAVAWKNLPVDTAFQNSYTITGSSWSGGTETLTITGLPNQTHLMGAFQLTGVNAACTTGATFNAANEILITNSSSTTVSYALATNPGTACTGTFKFPDVRQFDQRVYQNSGASGGGSPVPPTTLSATVQ